MSVMRCDNCDKFVDTDWHEMWEIDGQDWCEDCTMELPEDAAGNPISPNEQEWLEAEHDGNPEPN